MGLAWLEPKRARRGWVLLLASFACVCLFSFVNAAQRTTSSAGFELPNADWTLRADDLPGTWDRFEKSALFVRIEADAPELSARKDVWLRRSAGIRWTPSRWRLWLGEPAIISARDGEVCASFHPGPLTTVGFLVGRIPQLARGEEGAYRIGGLHLVWRDGFLLAGTSLPLVEELMYNGESRSFSTGPESVVSEFSGERPFSLSARMLDELEISISLDRFQHRVPDRAEYFAIEWPTKPIVSVVSRGLDLNAIVPEEDWPEFPGSEELSRTWKDFEALLPEGWRAGADTTQFALFGVDTSENVPVPDAAVYSRSETPLAPLRSPRNAIPFEWSGNAGWMTPWLGEGANLFVVADERSRVFTNQEATMAALMGRRRAGRIASDDARIEIDAQRFAGVLCDLARQVAKNELWPERNADDVERDVVPWLNAFGALGTIRLEGKYENSGITLRGGTGAPPKVDAGEEE